MSQSLSGQWLPTNKEAEDFLHQHIVGQEKAIGAILDQYGNFRSGFKDFTENTRRKPIGVFLFLGPSQVGKTLAGRVLGKLFYGTPDAVTKIAMETYNQAHFVSKLIGSPQGYIGYDDPPVLSKESLCAKIPGRKKGATGKSSTRPVQTIDTSSEKRPSVIEFLTRQNLLLSLEKGGHELYLVELELIDRVIDGFQEEIRMVEAAGKSGKFSHENEKIKARAREQIDYLNMKRGLLYMKYCLALMKKSSVEAAIKNMGVESLAIPEDPKQPEIANPNEEASTTLSAKNDDPVFIIILDEIEKAHPQIWNFFLQIFQEGIAQMANGEETNLRKAFFIMTSNLAAKNISAILRNKDKSIGFRTGSVKRDDIQRVVKKELERTFPQEFLNRIDAIITFNDLSADNLRSILDMQIAEVIQGFEAGLIGLEVDTKAREYILAKASQFPEEQAESISKQLKILLTTPLQKIFSSGKIKRGQTVTVNLEKDKLVFGIRVKK